MCDEAWDKEEDVVAADLCELTEVIPLDWVYWVSPEELIKAGFVGSGSVTNLDGSIKLIVDIDGRSDASACVHNNAIWMHLKACSRSLQVSIIAGSIMSIRFPRLYNLHACIITTGCQLMKYIIYKIGH